MEAAFDRVIALDSGADVGDRPLGVTEVVSLAELAGNDDELCAVAILYLEPLLDEQGAEVIGEMESAMRSSAPLRRAYSCADRQLPEEPRRRLDRLLPTDDETP